VFTYPAIPNGAVVPFDIRILLKVAWLDVFDANTVFFSPIAENVTNKLLSIIATNDRGLTSPFDELIKFPNNPYRRQREACLNGQSLVPKIINNIEQAVFATLR